ncbi:MAG: choice-of-anchor U domain-containing protein, partial [Candidatus Saccharibacteria bacterium]|nr:choice-of-anchor U domain-containing protein [Candidatus Saccharibacteria bacterium]
VYVSGQFSGTNVDFNTTGLGSPDLHTSTGPNGDDLYTDLFITKINADGTYGYTYSTGGNDYDSVQGVATDSSGNVYLTGYFNGTNINFNTTGSGSPDLKTSTSQSDIFITKINSNGTYNYTYTVAGNDVGKTNSGNSVTTDSNGNVYFVGYYWGSNVNFNTTGIGSPDVKNSNGDSAMFLTKINSNGTYGYTYAQNIPSDSFDVSVDMLNNVYLTGFFMGTNSDLNITGSGSTDIKSSNSAGADIYITQIKEDGSYGFTNIIGDAGTDFGYSVTADILGNIHATGFFSGTNVDFNTTGAGSPDLKSSIGSRDIFMTKLADVFTVPDPVMPPVVQLDDDNDGISNTTEASSPLGTDVNNNSVLDSEESTVATNYNSVAGVYVTSVISNCTSGFSSVSDISENSLNKQDSTYDYPLGLRQFRAVCSSPGLTASITQYFDKVYDTSSWVYRKYIPSLGYVDFSSQVSYSTAIVNGKTVTVSSFSIRDGGAYDADGLVNGVIEDPAGPSVLAESILAETGNNNVLSIIFGISLSCIGLWVYLVKVRQN